MATAELLANYYYYTRVRAVGNTMLANHFFVSGLSLFVMITRITHTAISFLASVRLLLVVS